MRKYLLLIFFLLFLPTAAFAQQKIIGNKVCTEVGKATDPNPCGVGGGEGGGGGQTACSGSPIDLGYQKRFLPLPQEKPACLATETQSCGRPGTCTTPHKIVLHVTAGEAEADDTYSYFAGGSGNRGVGAHFIVGRDGKVLQLVESLEGRIEVAWAVAHYVDHISIEMTSVKAYGGKDEVPRPQYVATLGLVKKLMQTYNIPKGSLEYTWKAPSDSATDTATPGVYGHYQLNPLTRSDPGAGFLRDLREEL